MNKTLATRELEYKVYDYLYLKRGLSCAMEVQVPFRGRADLVGVKTRGKRAKSKGQQITVVEVKTSYQDFKSKNGHNLFGNKNYYAMPMKLWRRVRDENLVPKHVGVMSAVGKHLKIVKNATTVKHLYPQDFIDAVIKNIDTAKQSNIRRLLYQRYKLKQ